MQIYRSSKCTPFQATFLMMVIFCQEFHGTADWSFTLDLEGCILGKGTTQHPSSAGLFSLQLVFHPGFHGTADWSFTLHPSPGHFSHDISGGLSSRVPWHSWLVLADVVNSFYVALFSTLKQTYFTERVASLFSGTTRRAAWRV